MRDFARGFYKSILWQEARRSVMERDHWLCQDCLAKGQLTPAEEVHHVLPLTPDNITDPEISLNPANLIALCRNCHRERHVELYAQGRKLGGRRARRFTVDEWGRVRAKESPLGRKPDGGL